MNLTINNPEGLILDEFIYKSVIPEIEITFILKLDPSRCANWTNYFKIVDLGWKKYKNNKIIIPSAYDILVAGIKNLRCLNLKDKYIIEINPNEIAPKTFAKLIDICALVNYGNLSMPPYPIFEDTFKDIVTKLPNLYQEYMEG